MITLKKALSALHNAINQFLENDFYLLEKDIAERSITHKIAEYLQAQIPEYNVDCEYNGDIENPVTYRKQLGISMETMQQLAVRAINENDTYGIYPDIIVHMRGFNDNNIIVIEVKKKKITTRGQNEKDFDKVKLAAFTRQYSYKLGVFLEFETTKNIGISEMTYYQKGDCLPLNNLVEWLQ